MAVNDPLYDRRDDQCPILLIPKKYMKQYDAYNMQIDVKVTCMDILGKDCPIFVGLCIVKVVEEYVDEVEVDALEPTDSTTPYTTIEFPTDSNSPSFSDDHYVSENTPYFKAGIPQSPDDWVNTGLDYNSYTNNTNVNSDRHYDDENATLEYTTQSIKTIEKVQKTFIQYEDNTDEDFDVCYDLNSNYAANGESNLFTSDFHKFDTKQPSVLSGPTPSWTNCGMFVSQMSDQVFYKNENTSSGQNRDRSDDALKQLMSRNVQSTSKKRKTILFLGHKPDQGHTLQRTSDSNEALSDEANDINLALEMSATLQFGTSLTRPNEMAHLTKKYQCNICNQIFLGMASYKIHMVSQHEKGMSIRRDSMDEIVERCSSGNYYCEKCGKKLKTSSKLSQHRKAHGNPDVECERCLRIFASKSSLKQHMKLHLRDYKCDFCDQTFTYKHLLRTHIACAHKQTKSLSCFLCNETCRSIRELKRHQCSHNVIPHQQREDDSISVAMEMELDMEYDDINEELLNINNMIQENSIEGNVTEETVTEKIVIEESVDEVRIDLELEPRPEPQPELEPQPVLEPASPELLHKFVMPKSAAEMLSETVSKRGYYTQCGSSKKRKKIRIKECNVCFKIFDRMGDLKRHLIEHVVQTAQQNSTVNPAGATVFRCEVCHQGDFIKMDKFKAHLREHAKLTLYKCTFCNKSFGDSSNFSKHKKVHGVSFLQCDLCKRKFNSKKMIAQHMEYHERNKPLPCLYCDKIFHFESNLKKHMKFVHMTKSKNVTNYPCKICNAAFPTLKIKWDHQWVKHQIRKNVVDCDYCENKFRKFSELKNHTKIAHNMILTRPRKTGMVLRNRSIMGSDKSLYITSD